jgi:hypothetical protein
MYHSERTNYPCVVQNLVAQKENQKRITIQDYIEIHYKQTILDMYG